MEINTYEAHLLFADSMTGEDGELYLTVEPEGDKKRVKMGFALPSKQNQAPAVDVVCERVQLLNGPADGEKANLFYFASSYWKQAEGDYNWVFYLILDELPLAVSLTKTPEDGPVLEIFYDGDTMDVFRVCHGASLREALRVIEYTFGAYPEKDFANVEAAHVQWLPEEILSPEDLASHDFEAENVDLWVTLNLPAMKVKTVLAGSKQYKVEKETAFETPDAFLNFLKSLNVETEWCTREDALQALGAKPKSSAAVSQITSNDLRKLVYRGWVEGLVKIVGPEETTYGGGVFCKIGEHTFWFGGSEAEEYNDPEEYVTDHEVDDILTDILHTLQSFEGQDQFEDELAYYVSYLRAALARDKDARIEKIMEYLRTRFMLDTAHQRSIENVLRWAFHNLDSKAQCESLIREVLDIGLTEAEFQGVFFD